MSSYQKAKDKANSPGPKYRTPDHFKGSQFGGKKPNNQVKFNPSQFKTQHKGG